MKIPSDKIYLELFDQTCSKKPNTLAVKYGDESLTYSSLSISVNRLANFLIRRGAKPEMLIGVAVTRSTELIISLLAVHKIGAAYVPLDPTYPPDRLKYMIEDSRLKLILSNQPTKFNIPNNEVETINLTQHSSEIEAESSDFTLCNISPKSLAYVMYTSGSTGYPKGVLISHANLMSFVSLVPKVLDMIDSDVYLSSASTTYALSVRQIFVPLSYGVQLVIAEPSAIQDPLMLFKVIKEENITLVDFVPAHWRSANVMLRSMHETERNALLKNHLRRIVTIGEALLPDLPFEWMYNFNHPAEIVNIFGQTETTGIITSHKITKDNLEKSGVVSIGQPIPKTEVYILEPDSLKQVQDGDIGELCVSNACVGRGYLNNPSLTSEKFIPNPFDLTHESLLYRTGDLARISSNGNIDYFGRRDQQVKVRGMRVELGEIEAVILKVKSIKEAVVVTQTRADFETILVAFLSTEENCKINIAELRNFVKSSIPPHMVPVSFVTLENLPHTPNGKIDRKVLMEYKIADTEAEPDYKTLSITKQKLLGIWKKLFKKNSVKITDNFFDDLGGDSLLAVLLFLEIEKEFNRDLAISKLYGAPTITSLANLLDAQDQSQEFHSIVPIRPGGKTNPLFIVHGAGGNVLIYRDLSKHLLEDMPIYGLQSYGLDDKTSPLTSIEEMADAYIDEIKKVQQSGPYFLCGYCMGGTVALEIARKLMTIGDEIAFLGLLESYNWSQLPARSLIDKSRFLLEKFIYHWKNFYLLSSDGKSSFLKTKWNDLKKRTKIWTGRLISIMNKTGNTKSNALIRQSEIWELNDRACFKYKASFYNCNLTMFLPQKRYSVHSVSEALWNNKYAKETEQIILPFYPAGMLVEPFVGELAKQINDKIKKTRLSAK